MQLLVKIFFKSTINSSVSAETVPTDNTDVTALTRDQHVTLARDLTPSSSIAS
jgi:hypothetical protein